MITCSGLNNVVAYQKWQISGMTWWSYAQVLTSPGEAAGVRDHGRLKRSTGFPKVSTIIMGYIIVPEGDHDFRFPSWAWDTIHHIIISALLSLIMSTIVGNIICCIPSGPHFWCGYESFATVGEIRVWWRADFQSGSRVLKKVFWTMQKSCWKHSNFENR